jgi:predicted  nucleic acid-binding Zn-ribbon protein
MSNEEMTTQPTIDTLLARFDEWGARFINELSEIRKGQDELRKGQEELRADLNAGLRRVERKIEILNDNLLSINADIRDLEVRMEKIEAESLARS